MLPFLSPSLASGEDVAWQRVDPNPDSSDNWVNIADLETRKYSVRVVATARDNDTIVGETRSRIWFVYVGQDGKYAFSDILPIKSS